LRRHSSCGWFPLVVRMWFDTWFIFSELIAFAEDHVKAFVKHGALTTLLLLLSYRDALMIQPASQAIRILCQNGITAHFQENASQLRPDLCNRIGTSFASSRGRSDIAWSSAGYQNRSCSSECRNEHLACLQRRCVIVVLEACGIGFAC
jgi:hypothetical protein